LEGRVLDRIEKQLLSRVHVQGVEKAHQARQTLKPRQLRAHVCVKNILVKTTRFEPMQVTSLSRIKCL